MISVGLAELQGYHLIVRSRVPPPVAVATTIAVVLPAVAAASLGHLYHLTRGDGAGGLAEVLPMLVFTIPGVLIGGQLGPYVQARLAPAVMKVVTAVVLLAVGGVMTLTTEKHTPQPDPKPPVARTLMHGVRRRCPHCGHGALFVRWITTHEHCSECGLVFVRNQGDTWLFWILMDRVPLFIGIVLIYFGFQITHWSIGLLFFLGMAGPLVATMPHRQGVAIALSYLSRVYFRDPSDELPGRGW